MVSTKIYDKGVKFILISEVVESYISAESFALGISKIYICFEFTLHYIQ